jgi:hypothetical protein
MSRSKARKWKRLQDRHPRPPEAEAGPASRPVKVPGTTNWQAIFEDDMTYLFVKNADLYERLAD